MGAERTGLWGHLLRGHLLRGRPGSDTQPCPAGRERRRARGACRGVGASRDSRGQCCFVRAHGFPSRPRSSGPGWGQKPSVGPWPGARGARPPRSHWGFCVRISSPGRGPCDTGQERRTGEAAVRGSGRASQGPGVGRRACLRRRPWTGARPVGVVWPLTRPAWLGPLRSSQWHFPVEQFLLSGFFGWKSS